MLHNVDDDDDDDDDDSSRTIEKEQSRDRAATKNGTSNCAENTCVYNQRHSLKVQTKLYIYFITFWM